MKRVAIFALFVIVLYPLTLMGQNRVVKTGIDVLEENGFEQLRGKKIGLVTNPTGVDRWMNSTIDILYNAPEVELVALFGPEHGVRGSVHAGIGIEDTPVDPSTGVRIYSLYGKSRLPSASSLEGLDAIVYDIQDIGCRSYTYISTMGNVMKVAACEGIEFIVLDRPNPLGGNKVEGPVVDDSLISFVGQYQIPYVYGLTCGELATLINEEGMLTVPDRNGVDSIVRCNLTVVRMKGWERDMTYDKTGLRWVPTSPHIPTMEAAMLYPATGIIGELGVVNIGVGYTLPFQMIASDKITDAEAFAARMNAIGLPGVTFRAIYASPFYGGFKGKQVAGVQIYIDDFEQVELTSIQFYALEVLTMMLPSFRPFSQTGSSNLNMFDKVTGTKKVREIFSKTYRFKDISPLWRCDTEAFVRASARYRLY